MCPILTILWKGLLKQETACEQSIKCITCHNLTQLFCACWSGTNLKMKLETVDRILMSRETTVVDPGGGTRGSGPPRPYQTWRLFKNFYCFLVPSYNLFASARKEVFPTPMATGVRRQSSLNQDPPIKNSWIRPWTSSLWCSQLPHSNLWQA